MLFIRLPAASTRSTSGAAKTSSAVAIGIAILDIVSSAPAGTRPVCGFAYWLTDTWLIANPLSGLPTLSVTV
jgi:hypothetical protein